MHIPQRRKFEKLCSQRLEPLNLRNVNGVCESHKENGNVGWQGGRKTRVLLSLSRVCFPRLSSSGNILFGKDG